MASKAGLNSELESFRQEWLSDLHSRRDEPAESSNAAQPAASHSARRHAEPPKSPTLSSRKPQSHHYQHHEVDDHYIQGPAFDEPAPKAGNTLSAPSKKPAPSKEESLVTALDHYESAMEREAQGNIGESLKLYRKAYRVCNASYQTLDSYLHSVDSTDTSFTRSSTPEWIRDIVRSTSQPHHPPSPKPRHNRRPHLQHPPHPLLLQPRSNHPPHSPSATFSPASPLSRSSRKHPK
jgi:F-box protein 9